MNRPLARYILGLIALLSLAACGAAARPTAQGSIAPAPSAVASPEAQPSNTPKIGATDTLLTIRTEGGLCGPGGCWSEKQIRADGTYQVSEASGAQKDGTLSADQIAALTQLIAAADFEQIRAQPFTGTCPIAYDGQKQIYTFQTLSGEQTIDSCEVAIDESSELFQAIAALSAQIDQQ